MRLYLSKKSPFNGFAAVALALLPAALLVTYAAQVAVAAQAPAATHQQTAVAAPNSEFFESRIRPILIANCYSCHGPSNQMSGLRVDSLAAMEKGGLRGPAIVPGHPETSRLIAAIHYTGPLKMPVNGPLKPADVLVLTKWVSLGAPWPAAVTVALPPANSGAYIITPAQRQHWSFRPIASVVPPKVRNVAWGSSPIDRFVLARLEQKGLQPNLLADRRTLIRRACFDLIGVPPSVQQVEEFVADRKPGAFARVVDSLLSSPQYGERWGRHWLDVARFADTKGYVFEEDRMYHSAYTYRDYVIRAFNEDLPYNRFITEQLAADRLSLGNDKRPLAAMGFLTLGRRFLNNQADIIDDRIDVTCRGVMALTVGCARCHDHKFDPIPTKDYYALYGVFASSNEPNPPLSISPAAVTDPFELANKNLLAVKSAHDKLIHEQIMALRAQEKQNAASLSAAIKAVLIALRIEAQPNPAQLSTLMPAFSADAQAQIPKLQAQVQQLRAALPAPPEFAMAMEDNPTAQDVHVFKRGNPANQGDLAPRHFVSILSADNPQLYKDGSGRLELAHDITAPTNPLTPRVIVNRVWLWHFGQALVRTPSDFGTRGEPPTNPELLDYLAKTFMQTGWSIKKLTRMIMLSSTYQQSSSCDAHRLAIDPENRLVSRMNRERLDLEALRDSVLQVSGQLDTKLGGPSVDIATDSYSRRKTVYGSIDRQNLQGIYRTFDFATPDTSSAGRYATTIPQQALFMMNSPFIIQQAHALVNRPDVLACLVPAKRIRYIYRLLFQRTPNEQEVALGVRYIQAEQSPAPQVTAASIGGGPSLGEDAWTRYAHILLMTNEFAFVD